MNSSMMSHNHWFGSSMSTGTLEPVILGGGEGEVVGGALITQCSVALTENEVEQFNVVLVRLHHVFKGGLRDKTNT